MGEDDPKTAKAERLKAALKANMARRKGQDRGDRADEPNHHGRRRSEEARDG